MINYATYCQIRDLTQAGLSAARIASQTGVNEKTVRKWLSRTEYRPRSGFKRTSKLQLFKPVIKRWIEEADFSAVQIHQKLRESGYTGGITILADYLRIIRPKHHRAHQTLTFAPGEAAQIDWGTFESIAVGSTRRKLSFLTVVLCHSRMIYVECFVRECLEHFLAGLQNAFLTFGAVPRTLIVDNMKTAVIEHRPGCPPQFNARFIDFATHFGAHTFACTPRRPYQKGRVESGVGYVKGNFFNGRDLGQLPTDRPLESLNEQLRRWSEQIANVRQHKELHQRPLDLFAADLAAMLPLNPNPYDTSLSRLARVTNRCRVHCDGNRYSVPPAYSQKQIHLHCYHDRLCFYSEGKLIATHPRSYERHQQIVDPDHERELLEQHQRGQKAAELQAFEQLHPIAPLWLTNLRQKRFGYMHHIRKILVLADLHGPHAVAAALQTSHEHGVYSSDTILNILERNQRLADFRNDPPQPIAPTSQSRALLEIRLNSPDLSHYCGQPGN